ncbi:methylenetetrahydrofolate reductase [Maricaulis parjimensis]|uniref:methylenetetrahydrofolate reductase n=1 Tax=Maricaulis parjimensis TaxID=144023 RepID=UPI00193A8AD9|nr:methylenetetrahydrofolate reductase [Maricaulis parjimensis]
MLDPVMNRGPAGPCLDGLLKDFTVEVTSRDTASLKDIGSLLAPGSRVFIASLPKENPQRQTEAAVHLARQGLEPVPHIVARNIPDLGALDRHVGQLAREAGVKRVLVLAGDRDDPEGQFLSALDLLKTGCLQNHGVKFVHLSAYPEGHPRISDADLVAARRDKLDVALKAGFDVELVSQFCFDAKPIVDYAAGMRAEGLDVPLRVGLAGPAKRSTLIKYAMICGVGPSLRALKEREDLARNVMAGETPSALVDALEAAVAARPELGISGVHFFTFSSLKETVKWLNEARG